MIVIMKPFIRGCIMKPYFRAFTPFVFLYLFSAPGLEGQEETPGFVSAEKDSTRVTIADMRPSQHVTQEIIQALPVDSYRDIVTLQAGVTPFGNAANSQYLTSFRGSHPKDDIVFIDGIDVKRYQTDQDLLDLPEFGMEEIETVEGGFGSEFGGFQSGVVYMITRDGGPELSGQLRFETEELNPSSSNTGYNRWQYSLGGPVPKVENLSFFFASDLIGKGDRMPRSDGFRGTTDDLFDVAARYSNNADVTQFLGEPLDITAMLREARNRNPGLPILNLSDLRGERFGGDDFKGRLPGDRGDEYRFEGKLTYRPTDRIQLTCLYLEDRDQGIAFDRRRIFWTEERNLGYVSRTRVGGLGYDHEAVRSTDLRLDISFRGSYQRFERHTGDLFAPFDSLSGRVDNPGESLGYHDRGTFLNFMRGAIPIFADDVWISYFEQNELYEGVIRADDSRADNPFGIPADTFWDRNKGFNDFISNTREDRADFRLDIRGKMREFNTLQAGVHVRSWQLDQYNSRLTYSAQLNFYRAKPGMQSFYIDDRIDLLDFSIDAGLRFDSFDAGVDYPAIFGDQDSERVESTRKTDVAPRVRISHPLTRWIRVRAGYEKRLQVPEFSHLYESINYDVNRQGDTSVFFGNPNLGFRKTKAFEAGFTALLSDDWVFDMALYNKLIEGTIYARYLQQEGSTRYLRIYANAGDEYARGFDMNFRRRFADNVSADFTYSLSSRGTVEGDPVDFIRNEGRFVVGGNPPMLALTSAYENAERTHTINSVLNFQFPNDFQKGTILGRILRNTDHHFTFQAIYGGPFSDQEISFIRNGVYYQETVSEGFDWQSLANLRVARHFKFGGLRYSGFVDIRNLFGTNNLNLTRTDLLGDEVLVGVNYSGITTIDDALDYLGISSPEIYIDPSQRTPTDINGDGNRDEADRLEIIRRLDMNGDGEVTVEEELAMAILSIGAYNDDAENFGIPRLVRIGFEIRF
jgi:hypothetical protein